PVARRESKEWRAGTPAYWLMIAPPISRAALRRAQCINRDSSAIGQSHLLDGDAAVNALPPNRDIKGEALALVHAASAHLEVGVSLNDFQRHERLTRPGFEGVPDASRF